MNKMIDIEDINAKKREGIQLLYYYVSLFQSAREDINQRFLRSVSSK